MKQGSNEREGVKGKWKGGVKKGKDPKGNETGE